MEDLKKTLINKSTNIKNARPNTGILKKGEIGINYADGSENIFIENNSGTKVIGFVNEDKFEKSEEITTKAILDLNSRIENKIEINDTVGKKIGRYGEIFNDYENNKAYEMYSHSEGKMTIADGTASHSEGKMTMASGYISHAEGSGFTLQSHENISGIAQKGDTTFTTDCKHKKGDRFYFYFDPYSGIENSYTIYRIIDVSKDGFTITLDKGIEATIKEEIILYYIHYNHANGNYSHVEGYNNKSIGNNSHSEGNTTAAGAYEDKKTGTLYFEEPIDSYLYDKIGDSTHSEGSFTKSYGESSHSEGFGSVSSGKASHSEGLCSVSSGKASHSEGGTVEIYRYNELLDDSFAGKNEITFPNEIKHKVGELLEIQTYLYNVIDVSSDGLTVTLDTNLIFNSYGNKKDVIVLIPNKSNGNFSHSEGAGTITNNETEHAQGKLNNSVKSDDAHIATQFSIGQGTSDTDRKNLVEVKKDGTTYINNIGGFTGKNYEEAKSLQENLSTLQENLSTLQENINDSVGQKDNTPGASSHGEIFNDYVNNKATGEFSHAEGNRTIASGTNSHAEGNLTIARRYNSHAEGYSCKTGGWASTDGKTITYEEPSQSDIDKFKEIGDYSHVEGNQSYSVGQISHAEGFRTKSYGDHSHAEGSDTMSCGRSSHAEGSNSMAIGILSHAECNQTKSYGKWSHTEGFRTETHSASSHAEGSDTKAIGNYSHSEGLVTISGAWKNNTDGTIVYEKPSEDVISNYTIIGEGTHAEGFRTKSYGDHSHAEGSSTETTGLNSHAEGNGTKTIGDNSHAEGYETKTFGKSSHAEGEHSVAYGDKSHAEGYSFTFGIYSHAEGCETRAYNNYSHAEGKNVEAAGFSSHAGGSHNRYRSYLTGNVIESTLENGIGKVVFEFDRKQDFLELRKDDLVSFSQGNIVCNIKVISHSNEYLDTVVRATFNYDFSIKNYGNGDNKPELGENSISIVSGSFGVDSFSHGLNSSSCGYYSASFGENTISTNKCEASFGECNLSNKDTIFSIGNGQTSEGTGWYSPEERKNCFEVKRDGTTYINGIGNFNGKNREESQSLQSVISGITTQIGNIENVLKTI